MKYFWALLLFPVIAAANPRNTNPTTPDQIWQNDLDLNDAIKHSKFGTTSNNTARPGQIGEIGSTSTAGNFQNFPTSTQYGDLVSTQVAGGDYSFTGVLTLVNNGATVVSAVVGISVTPGNSGTGLKDGDTQSGIGIPTGTGGVSGTAPSRHFIFASSTTVYLKYEASYSVATPQAAGSLSWIRIR